MSSLRLRWRLGSPEARLRLRRRWLDANPFCWLALRDRTKRVWVWLGLLGVVACVVVNVFVDTAIWTEPFVYLLPAFGLHLVVKLFLTSEASRRFLDDRRNGTLELLLCAPLRVKDVLRGQWAALLQQYAGPVVAVLLSDAVLLAAGLAVNRPIGAPFRDYTFPVLFCFGVMVFVVDLIALGWLGLWEGLRRQQVQDAFSRTILPILLLPPLATWLALALGIMTSIYASASRTSPAWFGWWSRDPFLSFASLWLLSSLAVAGGFGWWARRQLLQHFRREVARQFQPVKRPWWARAFSAETTSS